MGKSHHCCKRNKAGIKERCLRRLKRLLTMSMSGFTIALWVIVPFCAYLIFISWGGNWDKITALLSLIAVLIAIWATIQSNDTSRLCTGADLLIRLEERFVSKEMKDKRKKAAKIIKAALGTTDAIKNDELIKDNNVAGVLDFFSVVAILAYKNALDKEMIWRTFSSWIIPYYSSLEKCIKSQRYDKSDQRLYESLSDLYEELTDFETNESFSKLTNDSEIEKFYDDEMND